MMHQRFALRRSVPGVVHWMIANQTKPAKSRKGMRKKKRNCMIVSIIVLRFWVGECQDSTYQPPWEQ
jgi:hypothetical protein